MPDDESLKPLDYVVLGFEENGGFMDGGMDVGF